MTSEYCSLWIMTAGLMTVPLAVRAADDPVFPPAKHDPAGNLLPLQSYGETIRRGMKFLLEDQNTWAKGNSIKDEDGRLRPPYFFYCVAFNGNGQLEDGVDEGWRGTAYPAGFYAIYINSLLNYYIYSGNGKALQQAEALADWNMAHSTPADWPYGNLPYSTSHRGKVGGHIDGDALMTDKAAIMANAYLRLYQTTRKPEYLQAARRIADTLVRTQLPEGNWPFRVEPRTGAVREPYTSSTIYAVMLFETLDSLSGQKTYAIPRDKAFTWLLNGPVKNMNWNGFYEDIAANPDNRNNYDCIDTACYLIRHRAENKEFMPIALRLHDWMRKTFVDQAHMYAPAPAVREQLVCNYRMAGHTAHWAMLLGCLYDATGEEQYRVALLNAASLITYHLQSDNRVTLGPEWKEGSHRFFWYSNSFACMRDLMAMLGYCPEAAPDHENHVLSYSSALRNVAYGPASVAYTTDAGSSEILKLAFRPTMITVNGSAVAPGNGITNGYIFNSQTGILRLAHKGGAVVVRE